MAIGFRASDMRGSAAPNTSVMEAGSPNPHQQSLHASGQLVERFLNQDSGFPQYHELLWCNPNAPSVSGLRETDYPNLKEFAATMRSVNHISGVTTIPIPSELEAQFNHMQSSCDMGLFPDISRAWLTIDSNLFLWSYDNGQDIAFYDRLTDTIVGVGLIKPKKGVFKEHVSYLLCLSTTVQILLLGVMTSDSEADTANVHIILEPMFTFPTDNVAFPVMTGTESGRVFLGGRDGSLIEAVYRQEDGWFTRKSHKVNHSSRTLGFLIPSFLSLTSEDPIEQIEVDNSRNILFTRSEKGTIEVYDLGPSGFDTSKVASLTAGSIVVQAANVARTVDHANFRSIVHISAVEESESTVINLMAVTEAGVRIFFTTYRSNFETRPSSLSVLHIRLPPGFSASSGFQRPTRVHLCHHRRGTTIMLSPQSQENDMLWLLTNDPFPFSNELMEISTAISLNSRVWKMVEETKKQIVRPLVMRLVGTERPVALEPPLVVTQDMEEQRKFVFLTSQGIHLVYKPRPIDHLRKILIDNQGFDNDAVRGFFQLFGGQHAACSAIALACTETSPHDRQIAEWATLAFFCFTKDHDSDQTIRSQVPGAITSSVQSTQLTRQPRSPTSPVQQQHLYPLLPTTDNMQSPYTTAGEAASLSGESIRHNSLYLYFSRIIRPIWNFGVVMTQVGDGSGSDTISSSISSPELLMYIEKLKNLKSFLLKYHPLQNPRTNAAVLLTAASSNSRLREQISLSNLVLLIEGTLEILGLWKILNDHHFYPFANQFPQEVLARLKAATFRDLVMSGTDVCAKLASCLVQKFIEDNDTTDAISGRLNEACPSIFKQENALFAKAQEMIMRAKTMANPQDRTEQVEESAKLLKRIGSRIDLRTAVRLLQSVDAYLHIIEICITTAGLRDCQNQGLHFYQNNEPENDFVGATSLASRMDCYRVLLEVYQELIDRSKMTIHPNRSSPSASERRTFADDLSREESGNLANCLLEEAMKTQDELFHVAAFDWLFSHQLTDRLLEIKSPFLEDYLKRKTNQTTDSLSLMDLLWMFYERNGHHRAAAEILVKLAEKSGQDIDLNTRRQYLSRAIVCMKSQNCLNLTEKECKHSGEFLHELEEKMEVARIQFQILESLKKFPAATETVAELESGLFDITQLYEKAEVYGLAEHQLSIIHVANCDDPVMIEAFWRKILEREIERCVGSDTARVALEHKLMEMARVYLPSEKFFPAAAIIEYIESRGSAVLAGGDASWLADILVKLNFPIHALVEVYHRLYKLRGAKYSWPGKELQLLTILHHLMQVSVSHLNGHDILHIPKWLDNVSGYLLELQSMDSSDSTVNRLMKDFNSLKNQL